MYSKQLVSLGLTDKEAGVYEAMLTLGPSTIAPIYQTAGYKKSDTYNILRSLENKGLIIEKTERGKALFQADPPQKIYDLLRIKQDQLDNEKKQLDSILPNLTALFQTTTEKPIIQVLPGIQG